MIRTTYSSYSLIHLVGEYTIIVHKQIRKVLDAVLAIHNVWSRWELKLVVKV